MLYPIYPKRYGCDGTRFSKFETPFANGEIILEHGIALEDVPNGICGKRRPIRNGTQ